MAIYLQNIDSNDHRDIGEQKIVAMDRIIEEKHFEQKQPELSQV